jgi:hypothetical protein
MKQSADVRMTVSDVNLIKSWFSEDIAAGIVTGIDVFQEQAGDVVSLLGGDGLPLLGFARNRAGFYLVDAGGECLDAATSLEPLLSSADKMVLLPLVGGSRRLHRWFFFDA